MEEERVSIFIDGSNLYHHVKTVFGHAQIDLGRFADWLVGGRKLIRTYYYNAPVPSERDPDRHKRQQRFFDALSRIPYLEVRLGRLEPRGESVYVEKGVDVRIAVDMLSMAFRNAYDTAVLVSCDGDFSHVVDAVRDIGKHVEVACFEKSYHIRRSADKVIDLNKTSLQPLMRKKRRKRK